VASFAKMLQRLVGEQVEVQLDLAPGLLPVLADGDALIRILVNLAVNARDAMPRGGSLRIATRQVAIDGHQVPTHPNAPAGKYVLLSVSDTGEGMDEATRAHLFEPFFTTKEVGKGMGLGLSVVYGLVTQHKGLIEVESQRCPSGTPPGRTASTPRSDRSQSQPGPGTRFDIYLPLHEGPIEPHGVVPAREATPRGSETLLLAEDNRLVRAWLQTVLEDLGYTVIVTPNGAEAVEAYRAHKEEIGLVILDIVMPQLQGPQAYEAMHELGLFAPALFITGYGAAAKQAAAADVPVLQKPFTVGELARQIRLCLDAGHGSP
jgi:CheY-like chemotaxis protein